MPRRSVLVESAKRRSFLVDIAPSTLKPGVLDLTIEPVGSIAAAVENSGLCLGEGVLGLVAELLAEIAREREAESHEPHSTR